MIHRSHRAVPTYLVDRNRDYQIARAIAKDPEIYIFDDSFSALDYKTDVKLRSELQKETNGSTTLIVAQRISTILHADRSSS